MRKRFEVNKFGGTEKLGEASVYGHEHEVSNVETQSSTKIEADMGEGNAAIIRCFTFGINPTAFQASKPSKQDLFNAHIKGIEVMLWRDGMKLMTDVEPRLLLDGDKYQIFVGARPAKGHFLTQTQVPKTLKEIVHGS